MSDRNESNLEYRATFDFSQARQEIISIQESLRTMEQIGLAAFISIEDRAGVSAAAIVGKFSEAAKNSGVKDIATEVKKAMDASAKAADSMAASAAENLAEVKEGIDDVREAAEKLREETASAGTTPPSAAAASPPPAPPPPPPPPTPPPSSEPSSTGDSGASARQAGEAAEEAATKFSSFSQMLGLSGKEAEKADAIYARLLTQEVKLIATGDDLTRALATRIGARRPEAEMISEAIRLTTRLSETEIAEAEARARLGAAIEYSAGVRDEDSTSRAQALQVIGDSISALEYEDEVRRRAAAEAKAQSVENIAYMREASQATQEALDERVKLHLDAAKAASEAEEEATKRQIVASRERIAAERDAGIAMIEGRMSLSDVHRRSADTAREAEERATRDVKAAVEQRAQAYQEAARIVDGVEKESANAAARLTEERVKAEKQSIADLASGRKEAAEIQKATAREAAEGERQATALQTAAVRQRQEIQKAAASSSAASARLEATAAKDAAAARVQSERQIEQAIKKTQAAKDAAARLFERTARTFPQEQQQLNGLVNTYGSFTATLRQNGDALTEMERRLQAIIRANPDLAREVDILNRKVGDFTINANRTTFRGGGGGDFILTPDDIRKTGFALERFGVTGVAAFGEIFAAIGPVGIAIGALLLTVGGLIKVFREVAQVGVAAFKELISNAIEAGRQTEITAAQFTSFYKGIGDVPDPFAASEATLNRLLELSERYGQDVTQLGRALLPNVSGLEQLEEAVKLGSALAALKPEAGIESAQAAIRAGLGGDLRPIRERFEIPFSVIQRTRELQEELGTTEGFIQGIGDYLRSTGQDIDSLIGTANVAIGRFDVFRKQFERTTGAPIIEQIKESLDELFNALDGKEVDILKIADAIGRSVATVVDLIAQISTGIVENANLEKVRDTVFEVQDAIAAVLTVFDQFTQGGTGIELVLNIVLQLVTEFSQKVEAAALGTLGFLSILHTAFAFAQGLVQQTILVAEGLAGNMDSMREALEFDIGELVGRSVDEGFQRLNDFIASTERAREENDLFAESLREDGSAGEEAADAALSLADARRNLAQATEDLAAAEEKVAEERAEYEREYNRALIEQGIEQTRAVTQAAIDAAKKRVDAAVDNARRVADIVRDHLQDIDDATRDYDRKNQDIERDAADRSAKVAQDAADKRLEIERDYLRKLEDLRRKFAFDSQEAIRNNDAVAYLQLQRKLQFDIEQAAIDRDRRLADVDDDEDKAGRAEKDRLAKAREDAKLAHDRKLEDLRIAVGREIQERAEAYRRELADLTEAERIKREELEASFREQKEDFDRAWSDKLTDLDRNLREEYDLIVENKRLIAELNQQAWDAEKRLLQQQAQERQRILEEQGGAVRPQAGGQGFVPDYEGDGPDGPDAPAGTRPLGRGSRNYTEEEVDLMRFRARDLARRMNNEELMMAISSMTAAQLAILLRSAGIPLRDTGGHVRAGEPYKIGKPEILIPGSSGFIYPLDSLRPLLTQPQSSSVVNNVSTAEVNLSMLDPTVVDMHRRAELRTMLKEVLRDVLQ